MLASDLKKQDGDLAEIAKDQVASRIGSRLSDQHNAAQVRLAKGEVVEVLDEETLGDERWCKIAPPAGEFRWIQSSLVERSGVMQTAAAETQSEATAPPLMSGTTAAEEQPARGSRECAVNGDCRSSACCTACRCCAGRGEAAGGRAGWRRSGEATC